MHFYRCSSSRRKGLLTHEGAGSQTIVVDGLAVGLLLVLGRSGSVSLLGGRGGLETSSRDLVLLRGASGKSLRSGASSGGSIGSPGCHVASGGTKTKTSPLLGGFISSPKRYSV